MVERFEGNGDSAPYTVKYHLADHTVEHIRRFGTQFVLDRSQDEYLTVHIKEEKKRATQRRRTGMIETVNMIERSYKRAVAYGQKENVEKLGCREETLERFERSMLNLFPDRITITTDDMVLTAGLGVHRSSTGSFLPRLEEIVKVSSVETFFTYARCSCEIR